MKNILILEDDLIVQRLYNRALGKLHTLHVVGTIAEAILALDAGRPDVFISDMRLPDGIGTEAVTYCQQKYPDVQILIISGTLSDALGVEVSKKFEKPFSTDELIDELDEAA